MVTTVSDETCSTVNSMRYWSFTRMEEIPALSPFNTS